MENNFIFIHFMIFLPKVLLLIKFWLERLVITHKCLMLSYIGFCCRRIKQLPRNIVIDVYNFIQVYISLIFKTCQQFYKRYLVHVFSFSSSFVLFSPRIWLFLGKCYAKMLKSGFFLKDTHREKLFYLIQYKNLLK